MCTCIHPHHNFHYHCPLLLKGALQRRKQVLLIRRAAGGILMVSGAARARQWPAGAWLLGLRKVGSLKRRVRRQLARWEMKKCTPLWREAHFQVKMYKTHQPRTTFWRCDVEKVHAVVARSTFPSQNVQNTSAPDHFWKLRCRKNARRCGAKHISKSKCTKHLSSGPLLEVAMSKKCTPLWREARFQVKMYKTHQVRTTFGSWVVEKVHAVVARSTFRSQKC